jgi:single-stranded DNA-binding protein
MLTCIATGTLLRDPQERVASNGNPYATFLLRVPLEGEDSILANVIAFNREAVEAVMRLRSQDTVAVSGSAKTRTWERDGQSHVGIAITADRVMSAYGVAKQRKAAQPAGEAA